MNISKLNKAVAVMLVALINMLCLPAARVKVAVKRLKKKLGHLPQKAIDHLCGPEYVRVPHEAFVSDLRVWCHCAVGSTRRPEAVRSSRCVPLNISRVGVRNRVAKQSALR